VVELLQVCNSALDENHDSLEFGDAVGGYKVIPSYRLFAKSGDPIR
jgi:hypothetical protein